MAFVILRSYDNYVSAHIVMGRLEEDGIQCWLKDENTVTIDPVLTHAIGGIKLMVDGRQKERAEQLLRVLENEARKAAPCPRCGSLNVELVSTPRKASNWASVVVGFFTGYAIPVDKQYHCFDCGKEYPVEGKEENNNGSADKPE
jgi:DNA-directed RNA polymerase subunit RPC12/RpoP